MLKESSPRRKGIRISDDFLKEVFFSSSITFVKSRRTAFEPISIAANFSSFKPFSVLCPVSLYLYSSYTIPFVNGMDF